MGMNTKLRRILFIILLTIMTLTTLSACAHRHRPFWRHRHTSDRDSHGQGHSRGDWHDERRDERDRDHSRDRSSGERDHDGGRYD